jgi:hypothetical protein
MKIGMSRAKLGTITPCRASWKLVNATPPASVLNPHLSLIFSGASRSLAVISRLLSVRQIWIRVKRNCAKHKGVCLRDSEKKEPHRGQTNT